MVFTYMLLNLKNQNGHGWHYNSQEVKIRRDYILEDSFSAIYLKNINLHSHFRIQFID
jgi:hypothetical protein